MAILELSDACGGLKLMCLASEVLQWCPVTFRQKVPMFKKLFWCGWLVVFFSPPRRYFAEQESLTGSMRKTRLSASIHRNVGLDFPYSPPES